MLSSNGSGAAIALTVMLCAAQSLPVLAQDLPPDTVRRSLAVATPRSISNIEQTGKNGGTKSTKNMQSHKSVRSVARGGYPRTHFEKGLYLKQKNDLNSALIEFLNATQENPRLVKGFYEQALIFRERGYRKLAESALEQALAASPDYNEARVLLATVRLEQGNFGGAVQELSKSLGLSPNPVSKIDAPETKESSGLLSLTLPAILQSVHGLLTPPPEKKVDVDVVPASASASASASDDTGSPSIEELLHQAEAKSKAAEKNKKPTKEVKNRRGSRLSKLAHEANSMQANGDANSADSLTVAELLQRSDDIDNKKKQKQKKVKKSLLKYFKRGDEMAPPGEELAQMNSSNSYSDGLTRAEAAKDPLAAAGITAAANADRDALAASVAENKAAGKNEPQNSIFGSATTFNAPQRAVPTSSILGSLFTSNVGSQNQDAAVAATKQVKLDDDEWAKKLKYYVDHGANSLKNGEAFMFAEDTGEASLFLADGTAIRRIVAQPKDASDVMRERRPDIAANADDMLYGLSLLGKLIPRMDTSQPSSTQQQPPPEPIGSFKGDNLMSNSPNFWGWLKTVLKF